MASKASFEDQVNYFSRTVPGHLKDIVFSGCPELGLGAGGHGEQIAIGYRLHCKCKNELFEVTAYAWKEASLIGPVNAKCSSCGRSYTVFDGDIHGYDPVACDTPSNAHGEREESAYKMNLSSLSDPKSLDIVTYYPEDLFDNDFDEFADRRADLFTWIRIIVGEEVNPDYPFMEFECA